MAVDRQGIPLADLLTAANVNDGPMLESLLDAIEPIPGPRGRPRKRPAKLHGDKAYESRANRAYLRQRGIPCRMARKGIESSEHLGRYRWVVERTQAWLSGFRRLAPRYARRDELYQAFLDLGCAPICWNFLRSPVLIGALILQPHFS